MCVKLVYMCKVVHVRQSSLCAFVVSLMNQQQKTSKAINYFNWKVLIYCVLSVGRKWVCGPSPLIQHAFQCKNQFGFSRHLSNWRYLEVLYFHVRQLLAPLRTIFPLILFCLMGLQPLHTYLNVCQGGHGRDDFMMIF